MLAQEFATSRGENGIAKGMSGVEVADGDPLLGAIAAPCVWETMRKYFECWKQWVTH